MKKAFALLTALIMLLLACGMTAGQAEAADTGFDHLRVGNPTPLRGDFTLQLLGNGTSDIDVAYLVNGYNLVTWDYELNNYDLDPIVVSGSLVRESQNGSREYSLILNRNLTYSDGTPITAWDYAFSILLQTSPALAEIGASTQPFKAVLGAEEFRSGQTAVLSGVRITDDYMLNITVSSAYRPYYYELNYLKCYPMPVSVIAPGCQVRDDGDGVYMEGEMTAELLQNTLLDPVNGYVSHPAIVSGPYRLVSFDGTTAELEKNDLYLGRVRAKTPMIRKLTYTGISNQNMMKMLGNGEIDLVNKVLQSDAVSGGMTLVKNGGFSLSNYERSGLYMIGFCCEKPTVAEKAVRQAIACCLDKDGLLQEYLGSYGLRADGYYGLGQWMYKEAKELRVQDEADMTDPDSSSPEELFPRYDPDLQKANGLLDGAGWTLNTDGNPYTGAQGEIRSKEIDGKLVSLDLLLVCPSENNLGELIRKYMDPLLSGAGIRLTVRSMPWAEMGQNCYTNDDRDCDMFLIGVNFDAAFDATDTFDPVNMSSNYTRIRDDAMYRQVRSINTTSENPGEYVNSWIDFEKIFADVLPMIPLYSNIYFDFYTDCLHDYFPEKVSTWAEAMDDAFLSDPNTLIEYDEE